ncbi:MAG: diguanylate cyclase domain-containing protein [Anaerovoracaceae bacterium]
MKKILAIDDSQFNLLIVQQALEKEYEVITKLNGKEGIEYAKTHPVDLILLDIEMPDLDGINTMKILKRHPRTARIPIIFLTGVANHEVEKACLDLGARDFITKPFNEPVMRQRIKIVLELEALRTDLEKQVKNKTEQLEKLTAQIITVFSNSVDPLTGLWSRMYIEQKVNSEIDEFTLTGAMAVIDLDDFRVLNDALGYERGDACLKAVGECIKKCTEENDIAARGGANEFIMYFPDVTLKEEVEAKVKAVTDSVREVLAENKFHGITMSVGIAMMLEAGNCFSAVYFAAEKALHSVKTGGKNGIAFYSMKE